MWIVLHCSSLVRSSMLLRMWSCWQFLWWLFGIYKWLRGGRWGLGRSLRWGLRMFLDLHDPDPKPQLLILLNWLIGSDEAEPFTVRLGQVLHGSRGNFAMPRIQIEQSCSRKSPSWRKFMNPPPTSPRKTHSSYPSQLTKLIYDILASPNTPLV